MVANNGWYSVHDTDHIPVSGRQYLVLSVFEDAKAKPNPFEDQDDIVYYIATWHDEDDIIYDETPDPDEKDDLFGKSRVVDKAGFYVEQPFAGYVHESVRAKYPDSGEISVFMRWMRLGLDTEGGDRVICWKELDTPIVG